MMIHFRKRKVEALLVQFKCIPIQFNFKGKNYNYYAVFNV